PTQGVVQTFDPHGALGADPFGLPGRATLLGEEDLRVVLPAPRAFLPWNEVVHRPSPELHSCNSEREALRLASPSEAFFWRRSPRHFPPHIQIVACRRPVRKDLRAKSFRSGDLTTFVKAIDEMD